MLQKEGVYNDLSPALIAKLEQKILSFGKSVRYKFNIAYKDPDPEKKSATDVIYPFLYTLQPVTFSIDDKEENRAGVQKYKKIGMVKETSVVDGRSVPSSFKKVQVKGSEKGIVKFDLTNYEDVEKVWYLELCPKLEGGMFSDKNLAQIVTRIDEMAAATTSRNERTARLKALNAAQDMSDKQLIDFADAMGWDSSADLVLLGEQAESLAETNPVYFNELVEGKSIEYQAVVQQAKNKGNIAFDPIEYKYYYTGNKQTITMLSPVGEKTDVQKMAEFLQVGGAKADEIYKKLKELNKKTN